MLSTSVGNLLVNEELPEDLRDYNRVLDKKGITALMREVAQRYPEKYKDVLQALMNHGADFASSKGISVSLRHVVPGPKVTALIQKLKAENQVDIEDDDIDDDEREKRIIARTSRYYKDVEAAAVEDHKDSGSPYYTQLISGGRGNAAQLNQMSGGELLVPDHRNKLIPVPLYSSYADGVPPSEYWGSVYGTRRGVVSTKFSVAASGFFGKQLALAGHRGVVTRDKPRETRLPVGLPTSVDDEGNVGAVLAKDAGPYKAGTVITPRMLAELKTKEIFDILVHSPLTALDEDGGFDAWSAGYRERGGLARVGDNVGVTSAQSLSEPVTQSMLCLAAGTKVLMADGSERAVEAVQPGEFVMGANSAGKLFPVCVLDRFENGPKACNTYTFRRPGSQSDFYDVTCTPDHKILGHMYYAGADGIKEAVKVLPVGELDKRSGAVTPTGYLSGFGHPGTWARLLGVLLGDGCYTESTGGVHVSCADVSQIAHLNAYLRDQELEFRPHGGQEISYGLVDLKNDAAGPISRDALTGRILGAVDCRRWQLWLKALGASGTYAREKTIPAEVWGWDQAAVADFVAGLAVTDGFVYVTAEGVPGISFGSCSQALTWELSRLLQFRFGINPTRIHVDKAGSKPALNHDYHSFTITNSAAIERFHREIPLFGIKKELLAVVVTAAKDRRTDSSWPMIHGVQEAGIQSTWDLEVDHPDHLFVLANGLIVSNSEKHSAGGGKVGKKLGGFDYINKLFQGPEYFQEAAPLAPEDGIIRDIEDAPQGGKFIHIGEHKLYVHPGHNVTVKAGQHIEEGDDLTDGIPHPAELVKYRGIGEARKVFVGLIMNAFRESGIKAHRRNLEPVVAGLLNHVQITDPAGAGDHVLDDVVQYNRLAANYTPRDGFEVLAPRKAKGYYLEEPALHYSVGTKITSRVMRDLEKWGVKDIHAHKERPPFQSQWERLMTVTSRDPDWQTRLGGFYVGKSLLQSIHRGETSDPRGTSYFPAVAQGKDVGKDLRTAGKY